MKRRTFLVAMGASPILPMVSIVPIAPIAPIAQALAAPGLVALYEPALAQGRALARYAARAGMTSLALQDDIGTLWHTQRARVGRRGGSQTIVLCALRDSDRFVLERLAVLSGTMVFDVGNRQKH